MSWRTDCEVDGCNGTTYATNRCRYHYMQRWREANPGYAARWRKQNAWRYAGYRERYKRKP